MSRLYDSFLYNAEADVLECRLVQFADYDVKHILVEAPTDHQGHPKPLHYAENKERFAPWADRIIHVITELPEKEVPIVREGTQRDAIAAGLELAGADDNDMLLLADCDEMPSAAAMEAVAARQCGVLTMECCAFYVDLLWQPIRATVITTVGAARSEGPSNTRRGVCDHGPVACHVGGHHLTWLGGLEAVKAKLDSHCHTEINEETLRVAESGRHWRELANPWGAFGYHGPLRAVDVDDSWPKWVYERRCPESWFRPRS